jgi:hypothetical protein
LELFIKIFCRRVMLCREAKHSSARTPTLQKMCRCSGAVPGAEDKKNAAQSAAGLQGSGRGERFIEVVGLVGLNAPQRICDARPVAAATALLGELIQKISAFAGLEEALAPDGFSAGREFLVMNQLPWSAVFRGQRLAAVVLLQTCINILR